MSVSLSIYTTALNERLTDDMTNADIQQGWASGLNKVQELRDSGRFGMANTHPRAINAVAEKTGVQFSSLEEFENVTRAQMAFTNTHFNGDARAALDFIKEHGNDPRFANMEFNADNLAQMKQTVEMSASAEIQPRENFTEAGRPASIEFEMGNSSDMIAAMGAQGVDLSEGGLRDLQDRINQLGEDYSPTIVDQRAIATVQEQVQRFGTAEEISVMSEIADGAGMDKFLKGANLPEGQRFVGEHRPEMQERLLDHYGENSMFWKPQASKSEIGQDTAVNNLVEAGSTSVGGSMLAMLSGGEGPTNLLSRISLDDQGRPDLDGDGVGGIEGLIKALGERFGNLGNSVGTQGPLLSQSDYEIIEAATPDCWGARQREEQTAGMSPDVTQVARLDGPTPPAPMA